MAARNWTVTALLLLAGGFVAGRAFSQNEEPAPEATAETVSPMPELDPAFEPDPFEIPMPPQVFSESRFDTQTAPTTPTRAVLPMKYFIPASKEAAGPGVENLRERFTKVAAERASIMSAEELQTEIAAIEKVLREFAARESLNQALKALEEVVDEFPETAAGKDAVRAIDLLKSKPIGSSRQQ